MSEPTAYDLVQDTRIQGVEDLVQTTYQPFQGPEFSYPVVHQPMDDEMWQYVTLGVGSGILDVGGQPYWLRDLSDVTDTGKLTVSVTSGTAQASLRGFYHRLNQDMVLSFPPVSQKTIYHVVLEYDPLRHKEPGGPIRVRVLTSLDWSGGKHYLPLWDLERDPSQLLSQAKVTQRRPKGSPSIVVDWEESLPDVRGQLWGTRALAWKTQEEFIAQGSNEAGHPDEWVSLSNPPWRPITLHESWEIMGHQPEYRIVRGEFQGRGRAVKKDNRTISTTTLETVGWITGLDLGPWQPFISATTGTGVARVETGQGSGAYDNILASASPGSKWVDFSCMRFELRRS